MYIYIYIYIGWVGVCVWVCERKIHFDFEISNSSTSFCNPLDTVQRALSAIGITVINSD